MKKKKKIIIASGNKNKIKEISYILSKLNLNTIPQSYYEINSIQENRISFVENAILKARYASKIANLPALSDDSGLIIPKFHNEPGIYSSRYSHSNISNIDRLIHFLNEKKISYIYGFYYCVISMVFYEMDPLPIVVSGKMEGLIINKKKGSNGFGYDSCFFLNKYGLTVGEIDMIKKNKISHRAKAIYKLKKVLNKIF